jgi:hypothetical protein
MVSWDGHIFSSSKYWIFSYPEICSFERSKISSLATIVRNFLLTAGSPRDPTPTQPAQPCGHITNRRTGIDPARDISGAARTEPAAGHAGCPITVESCPCAFSRQGYATDQTGSQVASLVRISNPF